MTVFKLKVIEIVKAIPYGKVVSYGQVALMAGAPRGARQVGWVLNSFDDPTLESTLPWWRVINNKGRISIKGTRYNGPLEQKVLLEKEDVVVSTDFNIDIEKYRWRPNLEKLQTFELDGAYMHQIIEKYLS